MLIPFFLAGFFAAVQLKVGDQAPLFTGNDIDGKSVALEELLKQGPVVLAFFPKAFTAGWTRELTAYRVRYDEFKKAGAQIIALSTDTIQTLKRYREDLHAPYLFMADPEGMLAEMYGVKTVLLTIAKRVTFVINQQGRVTHIDEGSQALDPVGALKGCALK